jgi:cytochrome c oxidase subunit 2
MAAAATAFAATAAHAAESPGLMLPPDYSTHGHRIDSLIKLTTWLVAAYAALVVVALLLLVLLYRARRGRRAAYIRGDRRVHLAITGALAVTVFATIDLNLVGQSSSALREEIWNFPKGPDVIRVEVLGQQWSWGFRYAGADGKWGTADDVVTLNDLRVPVGRPVLFNVVGKDVIHSFYLPQFRVKLDAIPGAVNKTWFKPTQTGRFEVACSQHCGTFHHQMRGWLTVLTQEEFDDWYRAAGEDAVRSYDARDLRAHWAWSFKD